MPVLGVLEPAQGSGNGEVYGANDFGHAWKLTAGTYHSPVSVPDAQKQQYPDNILPSHESLRLRS